ncbi:Ig-like domain-containing protein [Rhizobium ruizarguesonis]|uniref:Ig-like domain-containing protein n=1 Tax=Rhizobium ruizarguesonis TaxID=2081791 RepID=UPI0010325A6A|nr:Ig-like domain-containing protein [Rhizobium ruizarguesonis]TAY93631.1 tandem-95 repeat protein [Rhizobium ruizarguesonis]
MSINTDQGIEKIIEASYAFLGRTSPGYLTDEIRQIVIDWAASNAELRNAIEYLNSAQDLGTATEGFLTLWANLADLEKAIWLLEVSLDQSSSYIFDFFELPSLTETLAISLNNLFNMRLLEPTYASYADPAAEPGYTSYTRPPTIGIVTKDYLAGATVFADFDGDKTLDEGELVTSTDQRGNFALLGWFGPLVVQGGVDTKTGLPFAGLLEAPAGSAVVTPLTTILQGLLQDNLSNAQALLLGAFGLDSNYDLTRRDPIVDALYGDPLPFAVGVKVYNTAVGLASLLSELAGSPLNQTMSAVYSAIESAVANGSSGSTINLSSEGTLEALAGTVSASLNQLVPADLTSGVAAVIAALNTAIDDALAVSSGGDLVTNVAAVQLLTQGKVSDSLHSVGDGLTGIDLIVSQYTGAALQSLLRDARLQLGGEAELNAKPTAVDDAAELISGQVLVLPSTDLVNNDTDADGDPLTVSGVGAAVNGTVSFDPVTQEITFTPDAGYTGPAAFTYAVSDGKGGTDQASVNVIVNALGNTNPVGVDDAANTTAGKALVIAAADLLSNDIDGDGDALSVTGVGSPANGTVTFDPLTQEITFTPDAGYVGLGSFLYFIEDGKGGTSQAGVNVTVANTNPVGTNDAASTTVNQAVVLAAADLLSNDIDGDGDALSITGVGGATNGTVSFDPTTQEITFTPAVDYSGPASFIYSVEDGKGGISQPTVYVGVNPVSAFTVYQSGANTGLDLVNAISASSTGVTVDPDSAQFVGADVQVSFYDGSLAPLGIGAGILLTSGDATPAQTNTVANYSLTPGTAGDEELSSVLNAAGFQNSVTYDAAYLQFSFVVSDPATKSVSFNIVFGSEEYPEYADSIVDVAAIFVNGVNYALFDEDIAKPLSVLKTNIDSGHFVNNDGSFPIEYDGVSIPLVVTAPVVQGTNTIKIAIADTVDAVFDSGLFISGFHASTDETGGGIVTPPTGNRMPVAVVDSYSTSEGTSLIIAAQGGVLANDTDADGNPLTGALVTGPAHGTLTLSSDGSFTYAPDAGYNGADSFTYKANDGTVDSAPVSVSLTILPQNDNPDAVNDTASTTAGQALVLAAATLLGNDTDADGDPLTVSGVGAAVNGTVSFDPVTQEITFTPDAGYTGPAAFTYAVSDGKGGTDQASVAVTVNPPPNTNPDAVDDTASTTAGQALVLAAAALLGNDTDADGDTLSVSGVGAAVNGTASFDAITQEIMFTPAAGYTGPASFTYAISDGKGGTDQASVAVTVGPAPNEAPEALADIAGVQMAAQGTGLSKIMVNAIRGVLANDTDPDGDTLSVTEVNGSASNLAQVVKGTYGALQLSSDGSYSFMANSKSGSLPAGLVAQDTFIYTVSDGHGGTDEATLIVTIYNPGTKYWTGTDYNDTRTGGNGKDVLNGGCGNDFLSGKEGADALIGGEGDDSSTGGVGSDTFVFNDNFGRDIIADFKAGLDEIQFDDAIFANFAAVQSAMAQVGGNVVITYDTNDTVTLNNVSLAKLDAGDFLFA